MEASFYVGSYDGTSLPANLDTLKVTVSFLAITSFEGSGSGDSATTNFTVPVQKAHRFAALHQSAEINGHQLTLTSLRVTPSMTRLYIKTDNSVQPAQSWALEATLNGSKSTFMSTCAADTHSLQAWEEAAPSFRLTDRLVCGILFL